MSVYVSQIQVCPSTSVSRHSLFEMVKIWHNRHKERTHLGYLDARLLSDVGLSRDQVSTEVSKPFWAA
jgi:uncharacterized protein YjiS (DUF1127 family)